MLSVLGSKPGLRRAAECWPEGVELWVGAVDEQCDERGMIVPGVGDIGDRLFLAMGKYITGALHLLSRSPRKDETSSAPTGGTLSLCIFSREPPTPRKGSYRNAR
ncbi:hypothetical protein CNMCM7691_008002 [Aspergillus felis]|uniref:Phosphoribosyltransferase domain-containing protein n=1 Tax=Aspergillus felis TaxID=1287682 RepID=A0A8H6R481_9EURO|nr:hypothetical protein CNMCM7691_008002 [Aspergillus felis]